MTTGPRPVWKDNQSHHHTLHHGPLVTAESAPPVMTNDPIAPIFRCCRRKRSRSLTERTTTTTLSAVFCSPSDESSLRLKMPTPFHTALNMEGVGQSHGTLPCLARVRTVSQPRRAVPMPTVRVTWCLDVRIASAFPEIFSGRARPAHDRALACGTRTKSEPSYIRTSWVFERQGKATLTGNNVHG